MIVDHGSDIPPYRQIADYLREQILSGKIAPRQQLPSIRTLTQEYGVARTTAHKALHALVNDGLARVEKGWGVFVLPVADRPTMTDRGLADH
jgi:DNA-binding GntR family transcriptional regulator